MVVLCDDNETYDNAPRPESHSSLPRELRYEYSKRIDGLSKLLIRVTALEEDFEKVLNVTNALYEWHVSRNHFPDTRGQHHYGGRIYSIAAPPLVPYEIPAASPTVKGHRTSFDWDAHDRMRNQYWVMCSWIYDLYRNPNYYLDTHYDWSAAHAILLATWPFPSDVHPSNTPNSERCTFFDSNAPKLTIQPESNERLALLDSPTHTPDTTMPELKRTQVQLENQPAARPCLYQDCLDALSMLETRVKALYERCKPEYKMAKAMYEWHLSQNHFAKKCHLILSKL